MGFMPDMSGWKNVANNVVKFNAGEVATPLGGALQAPIATPAQTPLQVAQANTYQGVAPATFDASTVTAPTASTYTPAAFDASKLKQATAVGYTAGQAGPAQQATQTQAVLDEQKGLVQNQINNVIDKNSPLMQRAAAAANARANRTGMVNSSMAVGAAQGAVYDAATPIATADAGAYNDFSKLNATEANRIGMFNAGEVNTTSRFNVSESNSASRQLADAQTATARDYAGAQNTALGKEYDATTTAGQRGVDAANTIAGKGYDAAITSGQKGVDALNATAAQYTSDVNAALKTATSLSTGVKDSIQSQLTTAQGDFINNTSQLDNLYHSPENKMTEAEYLRQKQEIARTFKTVTNSAMSMSKTLSQPDIEGLLNFSKGSMATADVTLAGNPLASPASVASKTAQAAIDWKKKYDQIMESDLRGGAKQRAIDRLGPKPA